MFSDFMHMIARPSINMIYLISENNVRKPVYERIFGNLGELPMRPRYLRPEDTRLEQGKLREHVNFFCILRHGHSPKALTPQTYQLAEQ